MSKTTLVMVVLNCILIFFVLGTRADNTELQSTNDTRDKNPPARYCGTNATATTLERESPIRGNGQFVKTGLSLTVDKLEDGSVMFYTCQITFQLNIPDQVGAHFKMRVKDKLGNYVMPDMMTGQLSKGACAYENATLSDTVYGQDYPGGYLPRGKYTFELWALAGNGELTIVPFMSNIAVLQMPAAQPCN